ncbi:MAG TPA: URC4/urg3 family protein [Burkholderiaceae bacterium]|nr:URC4/urg3 family protein [Burkholderiaceae bacterium]
MNEGNGRHAALNEAVRRLRAPATIRQRCGAITEMVARGDSEHFTLERKQLPAVAQRVATLTRARFPALAVPFHSRWRHFEAGGIDRKAELDAKLNGRSQAAVARSRIDLALISVLLDAGAGSHWSYRERESGQTFARSEGLAVASLRAFMAGRFSSDAGDPLRVDAKALAALDARVLAEVFQVSLDNPLVGLEGRVALLHRLADALRAHPQVYTAMGQPGHLFDALTHHRHAPALHHHHPKPVATHHQVGAARVLGVLLDTLSGIWPSGQSLHGTPLGDAWPHPAAGGDGIDAGWVPFHKLSQWLAYSLLEPFQWAGVAVHEVEALTGLPEYRNGGLLLDAGVIVPRDAHFAQQAVKPGDTWTIEWRALTVCLLDELAPLVRTLLGVDEAAFPLARLLEGGTWAAGRAIAAERRDGGLPPVVVASDGTVF